MLTRLPNETAEQYIWRLGELKSSGQIEDSWLDIAYAINTEFYGDDYDSYKGEAAYRKAYQNAKKFYDAGVFDKVTQDNRLNLLKEEQENLIKERRRLYDQRREYNKLITDDARAEHLSEELVDGYLLSINHLLSSVVFHSEISLFV